MCYVLIALHLPKIQTKPTVLELFSLQHALSTFSLFNELTLLVRFYVFKKLKFPAYILERVLMYLNPQELN